MIPISLQLYNFLSYGSTSQTIDFSPHKLIFLSGKNGHGKSALLDAMTWALWGQARKGTATAKPDEGLLRLGTASMGVTFDFIFNDQKYRVKREFSKKYGKPSVYLDFGLLDNITNRYLPLTDKTIRTTQEKIEITIGLNYETFINSSFLRQGQANEFSKKSPKERKEVVSTILGLAAYDKAKKYLLEKIRLASNEKIHLEKMDIRFQQEQEQLQHLDEHEKEIHTTIHKITEKETVLQKTTMLHQEKENHLRQKITDYQTLKKQHQTTISDFKKQKTTLHSTVSLWKENHKKILTLPDKKVIEIEKNELLRRITAQQNEQQQYLNTKETLLSLKEQYTQHHAIMSHSFDTKLQELLLEQQRLLTEKITLEKHIKTYSTDEYALIQLITQHTQRVSDLRMQLPAHYLLQDYEETVNFFEKHKALFQKWSEQGNWVHAQLKACHTKHLLCESNDNPSCPLCEHNLSQTRKKFLQKKIDSELLFLQKRFNRLTTVIQQLKQKITNEHDALQKITHLTKAQQELNEKQTKHSELQEKKETLQIQLRLIEEILKKETTVHHKTVIQKNETLAQDTILMELSKKKTAHETTLIEYNIQSQQEQSARNNNQLHFLESQLQQHVSLDHIHEEQQKRKITIHLLCASLKQEKRDVLKMQTKLNDSLSLAEQQKILIQEKTILETMQAEIMQEKENLAKKRGSLELQKQKRADLKHEREKNKQLLHQYTTTIHDDTIIATALGKDGVQALLIEDALPEIEYEANDLLSRLTDNQTHIFFESLRDLKKGGVKETLDINISDAQGIRPYELFSGGEAFRIDFALRIALSKLLARRAGTSLQTLIIDEGFGSQDEDSLSRMMDTLITIQTDFEKIIIVSHLPTMKEQFPVHFVINKENSGSTISVMQQ